MDGGLRACLIVPFRNEARHLPETLESLRLQNASGATLRFIFVDSASGDDGARIVEEWLRSTGNDGEILHLARPGISVALNAGISRARPDEIVIRLDAHTLYEPDYIRLLVETLDRLPPSVWWVGGAPEPVGQGFSRALVRSLMTNPVGLGGSEMRRISTNPRPLRCNPYLGAFRPGVLQSVGGFDERWRANEDGELAARVMAAGGEIWHTPARSSYLISRGPWQTAMQWHSYGMWRARTIRRHPSTLRRRHILPVAALFAAVALAASPARLLLAPLGAAFAALVWARRERAEPLAVTAASIAFFPLVHAAFATGLLRGWGSPVLSPDTMPPLACRDPEIAAVS